MPETRIPFQEGRTEAVFLIKNRYAADGPKLCRWVELLPQLRSALA
jgi:hypothetical protein